MYSDAYNFDEKWNTVDGIGIINSKNPVQIPERGKNMGSRVNSQYNDYAPLVTSDGKTLYYTRVRYQLDSGMAPDPSNEDVCVSTIDKNGVWSDSKIAGPPWNMDGYSLATAITADGNSVLLSGLYSSDSKFGGIGLAICHKTDQGWSVPEEIIVENFANQAQW